MAHLQVATILPLGRCFQLFLVLLHAPISASLILLVTSNFQLREPSLTPLNGQQLSQEVNKSLYPIKSFLILKKQLLLNFLHFDLPCASINITVLLQKSTAPYCLMSYCLSSIKRGDGLLFYFPLQKVLRWRDLLFALNDTD